MDESTNTLLYTGTYVIIFVIATSLSIILYLTVNRYADSAFEYKEGISGSVINSASTGIEEYQSGQTPLSKDDVFSYFVNYVKKDLYGTDSSFKSIKPTNGYSVIINGLNGDMTYKEAYDALSAQKYYIKYNVINENGDKEVEINSL